MLKIIHINLKKKPKIKVKKILFFKKNILIQNII